jgi:hypothetical protein
LQDKSTSPQRPHRAVADLLALFVTEGARKADAAVSRELCCIDLLGVWNWRGTNEWGAKAALPDWDSIALNGRLVYIVFDSDVMLKVAVHTALRRLKAFLEQCLPRTARPRFAKIEADKDARLIHAVITELSQSKIR